MTWPKISESTFPYKISPHNSWKTAQLLKWFATMSLWQSNDLSIMLCQQSFLVLCLLSIYWRLLHFLESIWFSFLRILNNRVFDKFIEFKRLRQGCLSFFLLLIWFHRQLTKERDPGNMSNGHWMSHHDIKLYNLLIVNSTQAILNIIEYSHFQI